MKVTLLSAAALAAALLLDVSAATAQRMPAPHDDDPAKITISCYRGISRNVAWDRPNSVFVEDLVQLGYSRVEATAVGEHICLDEYGVRNPTHQVEQLLQILAEDGILRPDRRLAAGRSSGRRYAQGLTSDAQGADNMNYPVVSAAALAAAMMLDVSAASAQRMPSPHDADPAKITISCYRGISRNVAWDRPNSVFIEDLVQLGYSRVEALAIGEQICRDEYGVRDPQHQLDQLRQILTQDPPG